MARSQRKGFFFRLIFKRIQFERQRPATLLEIQKPPIVQMRKKRQINSVLIRDELICLAMPDRFQQLCWQNVDCIEMINQM